MLSFPTLQENYPTGKLPYGKTSFTFTFTFTFTDNGTLRKRKASTQPTRNELIIRYIRYIRCQFTLPAFPIIVLHSTLQHQVIRLLQA
jgi:hypothetical protein